MLVSESANNSIKSSVQDESSPHHATATSEEIDYIREKNTYTHHNHQTTIHKTNLRGRVGLTKRISDSSSSPRSVMAVKHFDTEFLALDSGDPILGNRMSDTDCRRRLSTRTIPSTPETVIANYDSDSSMSSSEHAQVAADESEDRTSGLRDLGKELFPPVVPTPLSSSQTQPSEIDIAWLPGGGTIPLEATIYRHRSRSHSSSVLPTVSYLLKPITSFIQYLSMISEWVEQTPFRSWVVLGCAISIEIVATILLKAASDSSSSVTAAKDTSIFSSTFWMTSFSLFMDLSSILAMGATLKQIEVGVAYAVWSAVGTAVVSIVGILYWDESKSPTKLVSLVLIILGVVGLNLSDDSEH